VYETDFFQTIAEIGIGLGGFSGLVVALRRDAGPLTDVQKYRLSILFSMSFGAIFLSFVPDLYINLGMPVASLWIFASSLLATYSILFLFWWIRASRRVAKVAPEIFSTGPFVFMSTGHVVVLLLQLGVIFGVTDDSRSGFFSFGLVWYLISGSQQFIRMLFIQPGNTDSND
jgi:hypothetical protein